jgi:hypothetical protein
MYYYKIFFYNDKIDNAVLILYTFAVYELSSKIGAS